MERDCEGEEEMPECQNQKQSLQQIKLRQDRIRARLSNFLTIAEEHQTLFLPAKLQKACQFHAERKKKELKIEQKSGEQAIKWGGFLESIKILRVQILTITSNDLPKAIDNLKSIEFTNLQDLSLYRNGICSLQQFYKMWLPNMASLRLDQNHITSLKPLRKCHLPYLEQLDLEGNRFNDPEWMTIMHSPKLAVVRLQDWTNDYCLTNSKAWFCKLETQSLNYIRCPNSKRIRQTVVDSMLKQKYRSLNVMRCNRER